jgi:hypothetical protein
MIPVEGHIGLFRDETSNAIINTNDNEYENYLKTKKNILSEKEEIQNLKNEITEIKSLLLQLLNNKS